MESELVSDSFSVEGEDESVRTELSRFAYTNQFYKHLPYYLAIGMTPNEYWNQDCTLTQSYRKAFEIKRKMLNEQLWLQGVYNYEALCDTLPSIISMGKKPPIEFSKEPYAITNEEAQKSKIEKEKAKYNKMKAMTNAIASKINRKFQKKEG